jgi:protein ImuB
MPFVCIYVPNFPVAAALRAAPEIKIRAVAILEGKPPLEKIVAVNEKARCMGILPGMTKAQAELCTELALCPRSSLQESSAHAALLDCARSFSPCVEDTANDTVLLDLSGMESLFGSLPEISRAIFAGAFTLGLDVNVAAASNPDAAMLAARGFSGATVISAGKEAEKLGSLPVGVLFSDSREENHSADRTKEFRPLLESGLLETLERWGIRNLRALAALPEVALTERLGQQGLHLQQLARGTNSRTLVPVEEPLVFEEAMELEYPVTLLEPLAFLLHRLLEKLCARLAWRALATQELRLALELNPVSDLEYDSLFNQQSKINHQQFNRTLRLPLPMLDAKLFLKLLQLDLNAHPPGAPIVKIHLAAEPMRQRSAQGGLFLPPSPEPQKLELTLARIASIVGEQEVGAIEMLDTHHPEGFRMGRFVSETSRTTIVARALLPANSVPGHKADEKSAVTALRRFRPPLHAQVSLENGQPAHLICLKKDVQGEVLWKAGPWRFTGDWWGHEAWSRDEWDIALQHSEGVVLYRLVHELLGGGWFVEGMYD